MKEPTHAPRPLVLLALLASGCAGAPALQPASAGSSEAPISDAPETATDLPPLFARLFDAGRSWRFRMTAEYADGGAEDTSPTTAQVECSVTETVAFGNVRGTRIRCPVGQGEPDLDVEYVFFANPSGLYAGERGAALDEATAAQATRAPPMIAAAPVIGSSPNDRERSSNPDEVCVDSVVQRSTQLPGGISRELYCVTWGCVGYAGMGEDAACFDAEVGLAFLLFDSREGPGREELVLEATRVSE